MFLPFLRQAHDCMRVHIFLTIRQLKMEKYGNLCAHYAMTTLKETAVAGGYGDCSLTSPREMSACQLYFAIHFPLCSHSTLTHAFTHDSTWLTP